MKKHLTCILAVCFLPLVGQAHYLWIESDGPAVARIYFGEFDQGLREKAGGRLDERDAIEGWLRQADGPSESLTFTKQRDCFSAHPVSAGWIVVQDLTNEVKNWTANGIGIVKPMFYARAATDNRLAPAQPVTTLDIIPDRKQPQALRVFFKKQPLAKAKVMVHAPNEWSKELQTNANGEVTISTPWPGQYVIEVIHRELTPGKFEGNPYEAIRHRATFSHVY